MSIITIKMVKTMDTYQEVLSILLTLENRHNDGRFPFIRRGQHVTGSNSSHNNCKYSRSLNQFNIATSSFLLVKVHDRSMSCCRGDQESRRLHSTCI